MNPSYKIQIDVYIRHTVEDKSIWMRLIRYLPFVPRVGDVIRLTKEADEEYTSDLELDSVVWDTNAGMFVATVSDESYVESVSSGDIVAIEAWVDDYRAMGLLRVNYPQGQTVR